MNIQQLIISNIDFVEIIGESDASFDNICYDSRKCNEKSVFVAMRGFYTDGHKYIKDVLDKGVQAVICEEIPYYAEDYNEVAFVKVKDARIALAQLSHAWYGLPADKMKIIGVTGTNGKTTIAFIINSILKEAGYKTGVIGTTGIYINDRKLETNHTTPESLELAEIFSEMTKKGVEYVVMEVSSHALIQKRVHSIKFEAGVFSNLTHEHLDFHKNMDNYASAKKILFDSLTQESFAVINADSKYADFIIKDCEAPKYKVSQTENADFSVSSIVLGMNKSTYDILWRRNNDEIIVNIQTLLPGKFNVENISLAVSTALILGIDPADIESAIHQTKGAPGRMQKVVLKNGSMGIIDYAHTPDALEKVLFALKAILNEQEYKDNNLICVFGCGGDRDSAKRPEMGKVASELADFVVITDDNPRTENPVDIINDIVTGIPENKKNKVKIINSRKKAIQYAYSISKNNDVIIIAGKGHETYQIIGTERFHFDDMEELLNAQSDNDNNDL